MRCFCIDFSSLFVLHAVSLLLNTIILEHLPVPSPNLVFFFQLLTLFTLLLFCISHVFTMLPSHSVTLVHVIAYFHVIYVQLPSTTTLSPLGALYHPAAVLCICKDHQTYDCVCHLCHL